MTRRPRYVWNNRRHPRKGRGVPGGSTGPQPLSLPELVYGNIVLVGSEIGHIDAQWREGVEEVDAGYVRRVGGTGPRVRTGVTADPYVAVNVADIIEWFSTGRDAEGRETTIYSPPVTVYALPAVAEPAQVLGERIPGGTYQMTTGTATGFPMPTPTPGGQRQLGLTGGLESVPVNGQYVVGYRYRSNPAWESAVSDKVYMPSPWTEVITAVAVAPSFDATRSPATDVTEGDTVVIDITDIAGTPAPAFTVAVTVNGDPVDVSGTGSGPFTFLVEEGEAEYDIDVRATNGTAPDATWNSSFTSIAASTDVPPTVLSNPAMPALTEGVPVSALPATFGGTPVPTATHRILRRLGDAGTEEVVMAGLGLFTPAAGYQYDRGSTPTNGVDDPRPEVRAGWSPTVADASWAFTESDGVLTIPVYPGQPNTPVIADITPNSARIAPGTVASPAITQFLIMPKSDVIEGNLPASSAANARLNVSNVVPGLPGGITQKLWRTSAPAPFRTADLPGFSDTFAGGEQDLTGHKGESGHTWTEPPAGTGLLRITSAGRLRGTTNNATVGYQRAGYALPDAGGFVEFQGYQGPGRLPGIMGPAPFFNDVSNYLQVGFQIASAGADNDLIVITERRAGTGFNIVSYPYSGLGADGAGNTPEIRAEILRGNSKAVALFVDGAQVGTGNYITDYASGAQMGALWRCFVNQAPSNNSAMHLNHILAGDL